MLRMLMLRSCIVSPATISNKKSRHPHLPTSNNGNPETVKSARRQYSIMHQPATGTLYRCSADTFAYSLSIRTMIFRYSVQQPKWMTEKRMKKLNGFHNNPVSMTITKTAAVSERVLKTEGFNAIVLL